MRKFYLLIWLRWILRITLESVVFAIFFSFVITLFFYMQKGAPTMNDEVKTALLTIFKFWFTLSWSLGLLIALFRSIKYFFYSCAGGYILVLHTCNKEKKIFPVGYGDLLKVWRKWLLLLIWMSALTTLLISVVLYVTSLKQSFFAWFNLFSLYGIVLISGYASLVLLIARCKKIGVEQC